METPRKKQAYTHKQVTHLKWLNSILIKKEKEMYQRCKLLYETYEKRLIKNGGNLYDYEICLTITYGTGTIQTRYVHTEYITKSTFKDNVPDNFSFGHEENEPKDGELSPIVGKRLCWFFWKFWDDIPLQIHSRITEIWFEISIVEQQKADIIKYKYI